MKFRNAFVVVVGLAGSTAWAQPKKGAPAKEAPAKKSLYERLGGLQGITVVVDDFMNHLVVNAEVNKNPAVNEARKKVPVAFIKYHLSTLVCEVTGGPCKYVGRSMKDSHAHLKIDEKGWNLTVAELKKSLDKYKVPAAEQKELFDIVGTTKPDIVIAK